VAGALAGLAALLVGIGLARFAYTPLIPALVEAGWFTAPAAAYLGAANLAGYFAGALLAHRLGRSWPAPAVLRAAMAATTVSLLACAWPAGFAWFFVWRFAAGFTGAVLMVLAAPLILAGTPLGQRGRISGIIFTGVGLGIAASGTLVPALAGAGVAAVWIGLAASAALLTGLAWRHWPARPAPAPDPASAAPAVRAGWPIALLLLAYGLDAVGFVPHTVFFVDYIARELGQGLAAGGATWVAFGLGAAAGPFLVGIAADRLGFATSLVIGLALKAVAVGLPALWPTPAALVVSAVLVGALVPGIVVLASGRAAELAGPGGHGQVWGWLTATFAAAQTAAAWGMSYLFAVTGTYRPLFALACGALALATLAALIEVRSAAARPAPS
jgi:predicted MFS family arabinose efflux permease